MNATTSTTAPKPLKTPAEYGIALEPGETLTHDEKGRPAIKTTCWKCRGKGRIGFCGTCWTCHGKGTLTVLVSSRKARQTKRAKETARKDVERRERRRALALWARTHRELLPILRTPNNDFIRSLRSSVIRWGTLTPNQEAALRKFQQKAIERVQEATTLTEVPEGRKQFLGRVLTAKLKYNDFTGCDEPKMLVMVEEGTAKYKVWGTVPRCIEADLGSSPLSSLVGRRVLLTATLKRSSQDPSFGFYSRPTGAKAL